MEGDFGGFVGLKGMFLSFEEVPEPSSLVCSLERIHTPQDLLAHFLRHNNVRDLVQQIPKGLCGGKSRK